GRPLAALSADEALAIVRRFVPEHAATLRYQRRLTDADQWTLQSVIRNTMPMHRLALGDAAGTEYYVSEATGEPVLTTTASGRFWGYMSAVLHWLYFTPLRRNGACSRTRPTPAGSSGTTTPAWCSGSSPARGRSAARCPSIRSRFSRRARRH